jgi:hypothetical protein
LRYRNIIPVNQATGIYIVPEVHVVRRFARVTLHGRDIISIDEPGRIDVTKEHTHCASEIVANAAS